METHIHTYTGGMAQTNSYLLQRGDDTILIDAPEGVAQWLETLGISPDNLLLTHQHYDHVQGASELSAQGVRIHAHSAYSAQLTLEQMLQQLGVPIHVEPYKVDEVLGGATSLELSEWKFRIEHVPGHAPDSLVFVADDLVFAGDTLFAGGVGRTDLPGGDEELLLNGIREKIYTLGEDSRVFPGHGSETTVAQEMKTNPFVRG